MNNRCKLNMECQAHIISGPSLHKPLCQESIGKQIYEGLARRNEDEIVLINETTHAELKRKDLFYLSCKLADSLKNAGFKENDVISICIENCNEFFIAFFAAQYLSLLVAPLNHTYKDDELKHLLKIISPKLVFCARSTLNRFEKLKEHCESIQKLVVLDFSEDGDTLKTFIDSNLSSTFDPYKFRPTLVTCIEQPAVILSSSGTTGMPKGVLLTHKNMNMVLNHLSDPRQYYDGRGFKLGKLPFYHCFGLMMALFDILDGSTIIVFPKFSEELFFRTIEKYKIKYITTVPPIIVLLSKSELLDKYDLSSIETIVSGAAPLSSIVEDSVKKRLPNLRILRQLYGLTESTFSFIVVPRVAQKIGSCGKVVPNMHVKIVDTITGKSLGPDSVGELHVKGGSIMKGYYKNPEATENMITKDGWMKTGDLAYYDEDHYFYIVDRLKEVIKYKGFQVPPAELEGILLDHPKIKDAGVIGIADLNGEIPLAFVVKNGDLTEEEVKQYVAEKVSSIKHLRGGVRFVDSIPKNPSGKILRRELRELLK